MPNITLLEEANRSPFGRSDAPSRISLKLNGSEITTPLVLADRDRVDVVLDYQDGTNGVYAAVLGFPEVALVLRHYGQPFWITRSSAGQWLRAEIHSVEQQFGLPLTDATPPQVQIRAHGAPQHSV